MKISRLKLHLKSFIALLMLVIVSFSNIQNAYSVKNPGPRDVSYVGGPESGNNHHQGGRYQCSTSEIEFNPFGGADIGWELTNPVCITYMTSVFSVVTGVGIATNVSCQATDGPLSSAVMSAFQAAGMAFNTEIVKAAVKNGAACSLMEPGPRKIACCSTLAAFLASQGVALSALAILWEFAKDAHEHARVCGRYWKVWKDIGVLNSNKEPVLSYGSIGDWKTGYPVNYTYGEYEGAYSKYLQDKYKLGRIPHPAITNNSDRHYVEDKEFRELIHGGLEYEFSGCENPKWDRKTRLRILGYDSKHQRYYMTGSKETPNYACDRFSSTGSEMERKEGRKAYECCIEASQNHICLESSNDVAGPAGGYEYEFCELGGTRCHVKDVWYDIYESKDHANYICAKTYSVCPYNHLAGGGTEEAVYDKDGNITNHCQYLKHCSKRPGIPYSRSTNMTGEYIASGCFDLKGDSQNIYSYNDGLLPINNQHFSAPIAQCFHETLYNVFLHKAGHTKCAEIEESPDEDGNCPGGAKFQEGDNLDGESFFSIIQNRLRTIIKGVLTASIMVIGYTILVGGSMIARKDISLFIIKLGLVVYFALGDAWQKTFFDGIYRSSISIAEIFMRIDTNEATITDIKAENPIKIVVSDIGDFVNGDEIKLTNLEQYPDLDEKRFKVSSVNIAEKSFTLQILSTSDSVNGSKLPKYQESVTNGQVSLEKKLDGCQFPKFDYSDKNPNTKYNNPRYPEGKEYLKIWDTLDCKIVKALGMSPGVSVPNIFLFLLAGFLTGGLGIIYLFASLIFVFYLLSIAVRALHMFLLSSISITLLIYLSPIAITTALFKKTNNIFTKWRSNLVGFILQPVILFTYLGILITVFDATIAGDISYNGNGLAGPKTYNCSSPEAKHSIYCIFSEIGIKTNNIRALGLGTPELEVLNPFSNRLEEIVSTMAKAAFLLFIFSQFFAKISSFASTLVGGKQLNPEGFDVGDAVEKGYGALKGAQERGSRAMRKIGSGAARKGVGAAKAAGRDISQQTTKGSLGQKAGSASRTSDSITTGSPTSSKATPSIKNNASSSTPPDKTPKGGGGKAV